MCISLLKKRENWRKILFTKCSTTLEFVELREKGELIEKKMQISLNVVVGETLNH